MAAKLRPIGKDEQCSLYEYSQEGLVNHYYVASSEPSCRLMAMPEVVGMTCKLSLIPSTRFALQYILQGKADSRLHIFNILRGALNFPLEESCHDAGLYVRTTDFVTCERVIEEGQIKGLDIKYEKLLPERDVTVLIGDIIASGKTLKLCMPLIAKRFRECGGNIRRVVFFTIGGTKAIGLLEHLTEEFRKVWPEFEGFDCVFYEGVFTVYEDKGVTGVNTPDIDFGWREGAVAPEFRQYIMRRPMSLFEKCTIYDGGARRFEIPCHIEEVKEYWERLQKVAEKADFSAFVSEKLGYKTGLSYDEWLDMTHLEDCEQNKQQYQMEQQVCKDLIDRNKDSFKDLCQNRLEEFNRSMIRFV